MKFTDKDALNEMKKIRSGELYEWISEYPENERDGRSDMQVLADELSYMISCFEENGHGMHDDLEWAREVLRDTKNGKVMPLWGESLRPMYRPSDITNAKSLINEVRRLKSGMKRIQDKGFIGAW